MFDNDNSDNESIELEPRTRRALSEVMSVLTPGFQPITDGSLTVVTVTTGSGSTYTVDVREGRCTCPDHKHRDPEGGCKHLRRAKIAIGNRPVATAELAAADVADALAEHAPGPKVIASDGGVVGGDGAELVDDDAPATWTGPYVEYNCYGEPTGARYVRCSGCGIEVLTGGEENAPHRDGCSGC